MNFLNKDYKYFNKHQGQGFEPIYRNGPNKIGLSLVAAKKATRLIILMATFLPLNIILHKVAEKRRMPFSTLFHKK